MIRAVLDTNVIVSSFLSPAAAPAQLVEAWKANRFELCLSEPLYREVAEVLSRPAILKVARVSSAQIDEFLELIAQTSYFVASPLAIDAVIADDPDDDMILATALAAQAEVIVSGDHHLLDLKGYQKIPIVPPRAFLDLLGEALPPEG